MLRAPERWLWAAPTGTGEKEEREGVGKRAVPTCSAAPTKLVNCISAGKAG